jgi:hypothetical protein
MHTPRRALSSAVGERSAAASMGSTVVPRDWDRIVSYYHQHYASTIDRLFKENGYEVEVNKSAQDAVE